MTGESFAQYAYTVKTLGQKIRERREELDLSLREFAKKLKCSPPFISDVEHGRRFPSEPMLEEMARLLKLDLAELKQHDPRAPLDEIKRMTEQDPGYAFAFRTLVEKKLTPEELLDLVNKGKPPPSQRPKGATGGGYARPRIQIGFDPETIRQISQWARFNNRSFAAEVRELVAYALSRRTR